MKAPGRTAVAKPAELTKAYIVLEQRETGLTVGEGARQFGREEGGWQVQNPEGVGGAMEDFGGF